ncbi:MAG: Nif3-like dinuclear metal center hexameric protein [Pseudomonadaceae bacterium]|jgi:dinuclear metal center YbgI/SA1388 family protein|nr:Nif3-like dinuclear metal center hexameric protein [Pseudomonadaceae bacterium]NLC00886.1 Nif3-like dinuclear metal center hexameric protein [Halopseudomonas formosensis]
MMTACSELVAYCNNLLESAAFQDYCPNGLQVEGRREVSRVVSGVTASQALIDAAAEAGADLLLVHHGYFWRGEAAPITGLKQRRIRALLEHGINLVAYHLPLDVHAKFGNNVQLAELMGWRITGGLEPANPRSVGLQGELVDELSGAELAEQIGSRLNREPMFIAGHDRPVKRIAWCTGAAQGYIEKAVALGVDAFVTGEVSEPTIHIARECGINFYAAGHHATERYGVKALGEHLAEHFGLEHQFIDIDNPV